MYLGNEVFLEIYMNACILEWIKRKFKNTMKLCVVSSYELSNISVPAKVYPKWFGNEKFHSSHRAALLAKNYKHYSQFGWTEKPEINYYWPVK